MKIENDQKRKQLALFGAWLLCVCAIASILARAAGGGVVWDDGVRAATFLMEGLLFLALVAAWYAATLRLRLSVALALGLFLLFPAINTYVFQFRGDPIKPGDFFSLGTAANVADGYSLFPLPENVAVAVILGAGALLLLRAMPPFPVKTLAMQLLGEPRKVRLASAGVAIVIGAAIFFCGEDLPQQWQNTGALRNGFYMNLFAQIHQMNPKEPEAYDPDAVEALSSGYAAFGAETESDEKPVIIAIMDESFSDFSALGSGFHMEETVTPFIDSLKENTLRGYVLTSVFGGTTANAEWEFLTGCSMAWMPSGSVPYQQYMDGEAYSLVKDLQQQGYRCLSMHPFRSDGWNRPAVYESFGFDHSYFLKDFPHEDVVRSFISDREMFRKIIATCNDLSKQDLFIFGITMQNHGAYDYEGRNYEGNTVSLEGYSGDYPLAEQYLTLLRETDDGVKLLIEHFQSVKRPIVIVFFGDHYPRVEEELFEEIHGGSFDTLEEQMLLYKIPFFIWANYDIPEGDLGVTSLNFLGNYVMETAGLTLSPYQKYLSDLKETIPAMNVEGYYSYSQQRYLSFDQAEGDEAAALQTYEMIQFNGLFDEENQNSVMFPERGEGSERIL